MVVKRIGIRALNQNAGRVIRSLGQDGVLITDHGRVVARLERYEEPELVGLERLRAEGQVIEATEPGTVPDPIMAMPDGLTTEGLLADVRGDR